MLEVIISILSHRMCRASRLLRWQSWGTGPSPGTHWGSPCSAGAGRWRSWWWVRCLVAGMTSHGSPCAAQTSSARDERCAWRTLLSWSCLMSLDFLAPWRPRSCLERKCPQTLPRRGQRAWYAGSHPSAGWSCPRRARFWNDASPESPTQGPSFLAVFPDSWWQKSCAVSLQYEWVSQLLLHVSQV